MSGTGGGGDRKTNSHLSSVVGRPETFQTHAATYYEQIVSLLPITQIFQHQILSKPLANSLGFRGDFSEIQGDLEEIGYPLSCT